MAKRKKLVALIGAALLLLNIAKRRKRRLWSKNWLLNRKRRSLYTTLIRELAEEDKPEYKRWIRMDEETFQGLLLLVKPHIEKQHTHLREPISPGERLAINLRYLATGM